MMAKATGNAGEAYSRSWKGSSSWLKRRYAPVVSDVAPNSSCFPLRRTRCTSTERRSSSRNGVASYSDDFQKPLIRPMRHGR